MFQAVMIEDDETTRGFLAEQLQKAFSEHHEELYISGYESGEAFLRTMGDAYHYDILFLDIEMKGMDGITLAGKIRRILPQALLVFISSQEQLVFRSFEVQPFRFIRKQDFSADLSRLTEALLEKLRSENRRMIVLTEPGTGDLYSFDINDLLYVEAQRKDCRLAGRAGDTIIRCTLGYLQNQLTGRGFLPCHRSYLVNARAIYQIGKNTVRLTTGEELPLSRGCAASARQQFMELINQEVL